MGNYSITQNGTPLSADKYSIDLEHQVFSTGESNLVLDFSGDLNGWTFKTASISCIFKTGSNCTFDAGHSCTFDTGNNCTFEDCTFDTGNNCTFKTGWRCTFT